MVQRAEDVIADCEHLEGEQRTLRAGLCALDAQARSLDTLLRDPNLDPARWREPSVYQSLKRLFAHLIRKAELCACSEGGFVVELRLYRVLSPIGRENGSSESAWGSNPPARFVTAPTRFEDGGGHRATSALAADCRGQACACQMTESQKCASFAGTFLTLHTGFSGGGPTGGRSLPPGCAPLRSASSRRR